MTEARFRGKTLASTGNPQSRTRAKDLNSHWVTTRYGILIDTREQVWVLDGKRPVNVEPLRKIMGAELAPGFEAVLRHCARTLAPPTLEGLGVAVLHYGRTMFSGSLISRWAINDLRNYRSRLVQEFGHAAYLSRLRSCLRRWYNQGHGGVDQGVHDGLAHMRLEQHEKGRAVRKLDVEKGPLTEEEQAALDSDVFAAAERGEVALDEFAQYLLQNGRTGSGRRPDQLAKLKCCDVDPSRRARTSESDGTAVSNYHVVSVPRSKQIGADWRQHFRHITMPAAIFGIIYAHRESVEFRFEEILGRSGLLPPTGVLDAVKSTLPLFPDWNAVAMSIEQALDLSNVSQRWTLLRQHAMGREWHASSEVMTTRLQSLVKRVGTVSRTGEPLYINSQRMRYTKGTNLARAGASVETIAWLLDQTTTKNALVYVDNLPEHAAAINERLKNSSRMQFVARMFRGELVDSESDAKGGASPRASRILWRGEGAATCGIAKQCGMGEGIPIACYTCNNFQAWLDGPHEAVLEFLQRKRADEARFLGDSSPVVRRRDDTILAVRDVIQRCESRRKELADLEKNKPHRSQA